MLLLTLCDQLDHLSGKMHELLSGFTIRVAYSPSLTIGPSHEPHASRTEFHMSLTAWQE